MSSHDVRRGITNAHFNEEQSTVLTFEIFAIAIAVGIYMQSWWWFGGVLLGLIVSLKVSIIAIPLMILLSLVWGGIGFAVGAFFDSESASYVIGIIAFVAGLGSHFSALQWAQDLGESG